ncbi:hypothetical protein D8B23_12520 [Verminephrobacter aporrectodeae subsp. tuberculatae]|uniref:tetratricopeptide repeat protein n=1 Tax=Verminephrobacter aporrectodeae TaxID=1110389 RepID=UPI002AA2A550|nr:tetratricopeptide repeat protein [Verminephrobacter aporrectodeae]MCW5220528.1 hypothetical protein [Verminephrobacter aporrectodeae subsp. tuberculatae]MCW5289824.1 hypothetical protein [Verminephrobacter aporrectodeae subsp. tuberculatae]MCW8199227.1 hypothetical protein [Verminephrobacter aporrectodeae subsp. tuberculatae]
MKQVLRLFSRLLHPLALSALLSMGTGAAQADDHADITRLLQAGKAQQALAETEQRLAAQPRDLQLRFLRGVAEMESGKPAQAIATFTELTQDYPELPEPYNNLAVLYASRNQLDEARAALEMALRSNPGYAAAQENLGDIYAQLASRAYAEAQRLDAGSAASVAPKLALIRKLFPAPAGKAGQPAPGGAASATGRSPPA